MNYNKKKNLITKVKRMKKIYYFFLFFQRNIEI